MFKETRKWNTEFDIGALQSPSPFLNTFCNICIFFFLLQCGHAAIDPHNDQILHFEVLH